MLLLFRAECSTTLTEWCHKWRICACILISSWACAGCITLCLFWGWVFSRLRPFISSYFLFPQMLVWSGFFWLLGVANIFRKNHAHSNCPTASWRFLGEPTGHPHLGVASSFSPQAHSCWPSTNWPNWLQCCVCVCCAKTLLRFYHQYTMLGWCEWTRRCLFFQIGKVCMPCRILRGGGISPKQQMFFLNVCYTECQRMPNHIITWGHQTTTNFF